MAVDTKAEAGDERSFSTEAWSQVLSAVDKAYAELVSYQERLEQQNEELHEFRRLLGSILSSVSDVMLVLGRSGVIEEVSASIGQVTGISGDALAGRKAETLFDDASAKRLREAIDALRFSKTPTQFEANVKTLEGPAPYDVSISARTDDRGRMIGAVVVGRPLGELRRAYAELEESHKNLKDAQTQLVRNEKLASLGRLLAGVAHELNNPISFVYANAHTLEKYITRFETYFERVEAGAPREELVALRAELKLDRELRNLRHSIEGARDGAERVRDIVADLRRLSVAGSSEREVFDLVEAARVAARWVSRGSKSGVTVQFSGCDTLRVLGSAGHIQQVVMNLVQNAIDATRGLDSPDVRISIEEDGDFAVLTVSDNGSGIDPAVADLIFDPFFTTKPVGQGTGLGLSISAKIAEEHGGTLGFRNLENGSSFRLALPLGDKH
ncbi:sensor histidine kinase [Silicimonas sp. MF1-12-2]|uniref:sensor histidine kinase n=1 Tax=Silicimonas sp. MF1-12-2 TaxID=3384793 RepID=UPI0039B4525D